MQVQVVTPDASYYDGEAEFVALPAIDGEIGVLPKHAPMITPLGHGIARVRHTAGTEHIAVFGGFLKVQDNQVTVLAGGAAKAEGDVGEAEAKLTEAQAALETLKSSGEAGPAELRNASEQVTRAEIVVKLLRP